MTPYRQIITSLPFFRFMTNLDHPGSRIPKVWFVKLTFLLTVTFYLTKTENRTKQSNTVPILLLCVEVLFLPKTADFLQKNPDISKIRRVLVLKAIFSATTYVCVLTKCQISNIILTSLYRGNFTSQFYLQLHFKNSGIINNRTIRKPTTWPH